MPRVKSVKSLSQLCIDFVTDNIDYWCENPVNEVEAMIEMTEKNPFDELPLIILERIADALKGKCWPHKQCVEILLTEKTRHLDMGTIELESADDILKIASIKCPALRSLRAVDCQNFFKYAPKFDSIQILMFQYNQFYDDNCMKNIGTYCKDLRILDISFCRNVTDVGIEGLCVSVQCQNEKIRSGQCKLIQEMKIEGTKITRKGILMAIANVPSLQVLLHPDTVDVLSEIHQKALDQNMILIPSFSFTSLKIGRTFWTPISDIFYKSGSLGLAVKICPLVTLVHITALEGFEDSDLQSLLALNSLVELKLEFNSKESANKITFDGGVISLLKFVGYSLKVLHLEGVQGVNVALIAEYCPNLLSLTLIDNSYLKTSFFRWQSYISPKKIKMKMPTLLHLEKISVLNYGNPWIDVNSSYDHFLPFESYLVLFSSPLLKSIEVNGCEVLSSKVFQDAANVNLFLQLEELHLIDCNGVSKEGIDVFMNDFVPLRVLTIYNNRLLNQNMVQSWNMKSSKNNWELSICYADPNMNSSDQDDEEDIME